MRHTFSLTLVLFLIVWAFFAIDLHLGMHRREAPKETAGAAIEKARERESQESDDLEESAFFQTEASFFEDTLALNLDDDFVKMLAAVSNTAVDTQITEIDKQIKELEAMKRGFEARALRHDDQAQRLQFEDRAVLETRRHNELAEENRSKAQRVQQEIDRLQAEKRKLLQSD